MEKMANVMKALVSAFKRFGTFLEHLSIKYHRNEALKKIREATIHVLFI